MMKKATSILFMIILLPTLLFAQSTTIVLPTIPYPNETVIVPVTVTETSNLNGISSIQMIILFNTDIIEYVDINFSNPNFPNWAYGYPNPGDLRFIWFHTLLPLPTITPPEVLFEIEFEYLGGCSPLIFDTVSITGEGGLALDVTSINGSVGCAGVEVAENEENNIRIWSNSNNIIVSSENLLKGEIIIFDMMGKEIIRKPLKSNINVIPVHLKNTLYIVEVLTTNNKTAKKVLVK